MKRYLVVRDRHMFEGASVMADSEDEALDKAKSLKKDDYCVFDDKRRTGYAVKRAKLSGNRSGDGTAEPVINGDNPNMSA